MSYRPNDLMPGADGRIRSVGMFTRGKGISLRKRRRWYADDNADTDEGDSSGTSADDKDGGSSDDDDKSDDADDTPQNVDDLPPWAQKLLKETRSEAAKYRKEKQDAEKARLAEEQEKAEKQGEYKKLWDEAQSKLERLAKLEEADTKRREELSTRNEARIKELPKDKQKSVRLVTDKLADDPYAIAEVLDGLLPTLTATPNPPGLDGGSKGDSKKQSSGKAKLNRVSY